MGHPAVDIQPQTSGNIAFTQLRLREVIITLCSLFTVRLLCYVLFRFISKGFHYVGWKKGKLFEVLMRKATVIVVDAFDC